MAARKKPSTKKPSTKKPLKKSPARKSPARTPARAPVKSKKRVAPKRRSKSRPVPPMHAKVSHAELGDSANDEVFEIFKTYDRDGSGSIDRGELARLLEALGQAPNEAELTIARDVVDANHSGRISWDEFKAWWTSR